MTVNMDDENIVKEAIILHYLTELNQSPSGCVCSFIDFIETKQSYWLVMDDCGDMTLAKFVRTAHQFIAEKKLKLKDWRTVTKYIMWQLSVCLFWLHSDMNVCHLDLNMDNVMIKNGNFVHSKNGSDVRIDSANLSVKILDWGYSEVWKQCEENGFRCQKTGLTKDYIHRAPKAFCGEIFDGRKADCFSLGIILYDMVFGKSLYNYPCADDDGYAALKANKLHKYLCQSKLQHYIRKPAMKVLEGLLCVDESQRMDTSSILKNEWFSLYWNKYKGRITQKSKSQREKHLRQIQRTKNLPYYSL